MALVSGGDDIAAMQYSEGGAHLRSVITGEAAVMIMALPMPLALAMHHSSEYDTCHRRDMVCATCNEISF